MNWESVLKEEVAKPYFKELSKHVKLRRQEVQVFPSQDNMFRAMQLVPFESIKVVILGQDPYHGEGQANGLAFAVEGSQPIPPSLQNIIKEVKANLEKFYGWAATPDLTYWAEQGVFLLNTILTVEQDKPGSHANCGWETFTSHIVKKISSERENVVFLLWGKFAQSKESLIDANKHLILKAPHPSPLSAHRGFLGCKHFSKTNEYLLEKGKDFIDW